MKKIITPENIGLVLNMLPCLQSEIWKALGWHHSKAARLLNHMEKEGMVTRKPDDKIIGGSYYVAKFKPSV